MEGVNDHEGIDREAPDAKTLRVPMKRGFLFGLGSFFVLGAIGSLLKLQFIIALMFMPLSVVTIRAAQKAPPSISRSQAVIGWLIGFLVVDAVLLGAVGAYLMMAN